MMISLEKMLLIGPFGSKVIGILGAFYIYYLIILRKENWTSVSDSQAV